MTVVMTARRLMADRPWVLVGLVTVVGAVLRLTDLGRFSFWIDELITVCSADSIHDVATFFTPVCGNMHPPLDFLLVKWWSVGGRDEVWLRMLPALFGIAAIPVVYLLGREVAGQAAGLIAAALTACSPFLVPYDRELRMYSLLMLLSTASTLFFVRALRRGRHPDWAAFAVFSSLNLYVHYHATLVLTGQAILGLFWFGRLRSWRPAVLSFLAIGIVGSFWLPSFVYQLQNPAAFALDSGDKFPLVSGAGLARLGYIPYAFALGQTLLPWRPIAIAGVTAIAVAVIAGLWSARHNRDVLGVVAASCVVPILIGFAGSSSMPRYYVFGAPVFFIVVALGWLALRPMWLRVALSAIVLTSMGQSLVNYYTRQDFHIMASIDPWREVGAYLLEHARQGDCVMPIGSYAPLNYYTNGLAPFATPLASDFQGAAACLDAEPTRRLWVVTADSTTVAQVAEVLRLLDARFVQAEVQRFLHDPSHREKARWFRKDFLEYRISVYRYESRPIPAGGGAK